MVVPVLQLIDQSRRPRLDELRCGFDVRGGNEPDLGRALIGDGDQDIGVGGRTREADEIGGIVLLIDQDILTARGRAPVHLGRQAVLVPQQPVDPATVRREDELAIAVLYRREGQGAGRQITHIELEMLVATGVRRPGEEAVVRAVGGALQASEPEIGSATGLEVRVHQHLFRAAGDRATQETRLLRAWLGARVVQEETVGLGRAVEAGRRPRLHFLEQRVLQRQGRLHHTLAIGVLGQDMAADLGVQTFGMQQLGEPLWLVQPGIVVDPNASKALEPDGSAWGGRRGRQGQGRALCGGGQGAPRPAPRPAQRQRGGAGQQPASIEAGRARRRVMKGHASGLVEFAWVRIKPAISPRSD